MYYWASEGRLEGKRGERDRKRLTERGKRGDPLNQKGRDTQDDYELVDKEVINVVPGSRSDRGHRGAIKQKMSTGFCLIINFE